jgi:hypothetical protein
MNPIKRRNQINGQFSVRLVEMQESPAYRAMSRGGHLVVSRVEIELAHHGGNDNGWLPVTHLQFIDYGVHHQSVAAHIREAEALGFIRVTERGRGGNADHRAPSFFFLTFAHNRDSLKTPPSHEWRRIKTMEEAKQIAQNARASKDKRAVSLGKQNWRRRRSAAAASKTFPATGFRSFSLPDSGSEKASSPLPESGSTGSLPESGSTSISGRGGEAPADLSDPDAAPTPGAEPAGRWTQARTRC